MTDRDDDEVASGVPMRSERSESGAHVVSDSGRHTNRNVVQRVTTLDRIGQGGSGLLRVHAPPIQPDDFDVVTPVLPQPRDVFVDEEATLSHDEPEPAGPPKRGPAGEVAAARSDAIMARVRERLPRITPSPIVGPLPESRRASTEPGHVEPRRRPTTPPPRLRSPSGPPAPDAPPGAPPDSPVDSPADSPIRPPVADLPPRRDRVISDSDRTPTGP